MNVDGLLKVTGYYDDEATEPEPSSVAYFVSDEYAYVYGRALITDPENKLVTVSVASAHIDNEEVQE